MLLWFVGNFEPLEILKNAYLRQLLVDMIDSLCDIMIIGVLCVRNDYLGGHQYQNNCPYANVCVSC